MTTRRGVVKKKRIHESAHGRAMANPMVQGMVSDVGRCWAAMGMVERGERLRELSVLGCSARGLEKELKKSATSIRRHMVLADLPEKVREAIGAGASVKKILERKASDHRHRLREERIIEDLKTGALSDKVARTIIEFCRAKEGLRRVPVFGECAHQLINETLRGSIYIRRSRPQNGQSFKKEGDEGIIQ